MVKKTANEKEAVARSFSRQLANLESEVVCRSCNVLHELNTH